MKKTNLKTNKVGLLVDFIYNKIDQKLQDEDFKSEIFNLYENNNVDEATDMIYELTYIFLNDLMHYLKNDNKIVKCNNNSLGHSMNNSTFYQLNSISIDRNIIHNIVINIDDNEITYKKCLTQFNAFTEGVFNVRGFKTEYNEQECLYKKVGKEIRLGQILIGNLDLYEVYDSDIIRLKDLIDKKDKLYLELEEYTNKISILKQDIANNDFVIDFMKNNNIEFEKSYIIKSNMIMNIINSEDEDKDIKSELDEILTLNLLDV